MNTQTPPNPNQEIVFPNNMDARLVSFKVLLRLDEYAYRLHSDQLVNLNCDNENLDKRERALTYNIVSGVIRNKEFLDFYIEHYIDKPTAWIEKELVTLLRLSFYQLLFLDRTAEYAVVNESVNIAKKIGRYRWSGFVNGILRAYLRDKNPPKINQDILRVKYSHPAWMIDEWLDDHGHDKTIQILEWNNKQPKQYARLRSNYAEIKTQLGSSCIDSNYADDIVEILRTSEVINSQSFKDGLIYLMQPWSAYVSRQLPLFKGDRVLDMCAAPGGKTVAVYDYEDVDIVAIDSSEKRLVILEQNLERCNLNDNVEIFRVDGRDAAIEFGQESFDAVIVDAPCSNLGVIQRNPEVRWRILRKDVEALARLQKELLKAAVEVVKFNGFILYSICTFTQTESAELIDSLLSDFPEIELVNSKLTIPGEKGYNGGYWALLKKV